MIFAKAAALGETTNIEAEALAIKQVVSVCLEHTNLGVLIETDSLTLMKMITKQWRVPWALIEVIEEIRFNVKVVQEKVIHTYRKGNLVVDALANGVIELQ